MKKLLPFVLLTFFGLAINAQEIKIEIEKGYELESIETKGSEGFVCVLLTNNPTNKENDFKFRFYDSNMEFVKEEGFHLEKYSFDKDVVRTDENIHRVYVTMSGKIIIHSESKKNFDSFDVEVDLPTKRSAVGDMIVQEDFIWFIMRIGSEWGVFKVNWRNGESVFFPVKLEGIERLKINGFQLVESGDVFVFVTTEVENNEYRQYAVRFTATGEEVESILVTRRKVLTMKVEVISEDEFLFVGTYTADKHYDGSKGLFVAAYDNSEIFKEQILDYIDITNFSNYISAKDKAYHYNVGNVEIISTENGFIVVGEVSSPVKYQDREGHAYVDHYRYTHGFVCILDKEGRISWSEAFTDAFHYYSDISQTSLIIVEVDTETYNLKNYVSGNNFQVDLLDQNVTVLPKEELDKGQSSRFSIDFTKYDGFKMWGKDAMLVYKQEKVKTNDGKKMILTITKITE